MRKAQLFQKSNIIIVIIIIIITPKKKKRSKRRRSKKNGCLILLSSQSHKSTTRKINTFNSYQHGERCDRFIDGFLFHSIRRRALVRRHLSSKLSLSKSSRLFFAFVFFFFNDEFFLREKCKKRRICVSGFTKKSASFCFLLFFCSPAALFFLCFLRFLSAPHSQKKISNFFLSHTRNVPFYFSSSHFLKIYALLCCCSSSFCCERT